MTPQWTPPGTRGARLAKSPAPSVVVASFRERELLDACLGSLLEQCAHHGAQLIVARADDDENVAELAAAYPTVRFVACERGMSVPRLRAAGMACATGDLVAITEDHCIASPGWLAELLEAWRGSESDVVGGAMDNAQRQRALDWAAYFAEYGFFGGDGAAPILTGANVAYDRAVVADVTTSAARGDWENVVHDELASRGHELRFHRPAAIYQNKNYSFRAFMGDRYSHGLSYARRRLDAGGRRWVLLMLSPLLPFVLTLRVGIASARSRKLAFLRALPFTLSFLTAWSVGEAVGYWRGPTTTGEGAP